MPSRSRSPRRSPAIRTCSRRRRRVCAAPSAITPRRVLPEHAADARPPFADGVDQRLGEHPAQGIHVQRVEAIDPARVGAHDGMAACQEFPVRRHVHGSTRLPGLGEPAVAATDSWTCSPISRAVSEAIVQLSSSVVAAASRTHRHLPARGAARDLPIAIACASASSSAAAIFESSRSRTRLPSRGWPRRSAGSGSRRSMPR